MIRKPSLLRHVYVHAGMFATVAVLTILLAVALPRIGISADDLRPAAEGAAVSPVLTYQGRLLNPTTGAPQPNGMYTFVFRVYNVESGGTALWTETKDLPVANGLFVTLLGDTAAFPANLFDGQNLWLGIKVGADPEATPRQRLAPVAYAMYSDNADRLDAQDSAFFRNATNINAGTLADARIPAAIARDAEVFSLVTAADGTGTGLDADLLDGQEGAFYRSASNINAGTLADARIPAAIARDAEVFSLVTAADGTGTGLDADLLDGKDSADFAAVSHNHDSRYYTEGESDGRFVNATGDSMSGASTDPILAVTQTGTGVSGYFTSTASYGVHGETASSDNGIAGVRGTAGLPGTTITGKYGVLGQSDTGKGVTGVSKDDYGVYGWSTNTWAIRGEGQFGGVYALTWGAGNDAIRGTNTATTGSSWGVVGTSASSTGRGTVGINSATTGTAEGVYGQSSSTSGRGISGYTSATSGGTYGVYGRSSSTNNGAGVRGDGPYLGVWGEGARSGVYGRATGTTNAWSIWGWSDGGTGNYAGYFSGNVHVNGTLSKAAGTFKIDHPLDPENKYLSHSFVESPDMMNVYNGNATLDANGEAWVDLPAYFEALNRDFRYQLTSIGGPGPNLYIAQEVQNNRFQIAGGAPGLRVSWQVTGIRQDPYARDNPIVVEEEKSAEERGTYLYPEGYGQDRSRSLDYERTQELLTANQDLTTPRTTEGSDKPAIDPASMQPQAIDNQ